MDKERDRLTKDFLPGTRKWLLDQVLGFLSAGDDDDDGSPTQRIMWLRGVAGVGKSVMAAIVAGELQAQSLLGGQFFCKHDDERRSSARNLILTLAFGLAQFSVHYGNLLLSIKATFPEILGRPIQEMFEALVQVPLQKLSSSGKLRQSVVLVVDALDECGRQNQRREILQVFAELSKTLPAQVKLLVTGRPEADIKEALEMLPTKSIEPSDEDNHRDQIFFAKHFLAAHGLEPSLVDEGADALVKKSSGVFVWLVTACKYLESSDSITLSVIQDLPEGGKLDGSMDAMYTRTFERMFGATVLQTTLRYVLSTIVLVHEPLTATGIVSLLSEDDPVDVYRAIRMLEPVLVLDTTTKKLRIFHKSVKDYLVDMSRCKNPLFQIDVFKDHALIAKWCITALNRNLKFNMCNLALPGFHADVPNFEAKVKSDIPEHVRYSAKHFWEHACATIDSLQPILCSLFLANAHHLLEALSLLQCVSLAVPATVALEQAVGEDVEVQTPSTGRFKMRGLLQDVRRAVQMFQIPLRESALQVYFSAVPLSPSESAFHRLMAERGPAGIRAAAAERGGLARWSGCVNVLEGHTSLVHAAAFSADGRRVVSGSWDRTVRVWEAATGEEVRRLVGHSGEVHGAAFSPDGRMIASGGERGEVFVWDAETGEKLRELVGHVGWTSAVAFSPDGARIASAGMDCTTRVWDVATGKQLFKFGGRGRAGQWNAAFYTTSVAFNPLGRFLAVGSRDKMIYIYDFEQGQEALRITSHLGYVNGVAYSPDGQRLVSGSYDTTVRTWSANTGQELAVCIGHESEVHSVAFCPDGGRVVSGSSDKSIRVWNADTGEQLQILQSHHTEIHSLAYSPDGRFIVSGGYDQLIRIWSASSGESPDERGGGHAKRVKCAAVSGDRRLVVSGSADKTVRVWDVATGREVHRLEGHRGAVTSVGISNVDGGGGQLVVSAADDRSVRVWSVATGLEVHKFTVRRDDAVAAAVSADGRWVAFGRRDGGRAVLVWDSVTGREFSRVLAERGTGGGGGDVGDGAGMEADEAAVGDDVEWIDVFADQGLVARGGSVGVPSAEAAAAAAVDAGWVALENALVPFWLPPELRGEIQIVDESRFFALGAGMALAIAMPAVAVDTAWFG
ncbi:hypothetical protein DFJ73DRAFT_626419 [Zopfochytrium polystomum]|nr:hypothetical protein DFJ73DRAFT_626419 [Zopfochytrium polystomum]